ncbi:MAG: hypothetical protein ABIP78_12060 [Pyrinomonadaceae bacterium]
MLKRYAALVITALLMGVLLNAQDKRADATIKVDTRLVSVPVIVSDCNGGMCQIWQRRI